MRIAFTVNGYPPKKRQDVSMWALDQEVKRVIALRRAALEAKERAGLKDCFRGYVALELTIFIPAMEGASVGDLDNFVSGVCDGLQKADSNVKEVHRWFEEPGLEGIAPREALLFADDKQVVSIRAEKQTVGGERQAYYVVIVEEVGERR